MPGLLSTVKAPTESNAYDILIMVTIKNFPQKKKKKSALKLTSRYPGPHAIHRKSIDQTLSEF